LRGFTYEEMHIFARRAIEAIVRQRLPVRTMTTTIHGAGYGLDGGESLQRLVQGFQEGLARHPGAGIEKIIFLSIREREYKMLSAMLSVMQRTAEEDRSTPILKRRSEDDIPKRPTIPARAKAAAASREKKKVFVAMPFTEEFQNVYDFGIYPAVRNCGLICERVDEVHFTGDILSRIKESIESASLVIADMTEARPNVYLEVGYAWGTKVPVICVARKGEKLHFDVTTHRCIFYGRFTQFAKDLEELIRGIGVAQPD